MIQLKNVTFYYGEDKISGSLNNINIEIKKGELALFCGASGSGKTTITRLINGLIPHYYEGNLEGKVIVKGKNVAEIPLYDIASIVGTVFQNPRSQFFNVDTTSELAFGCENRGMEEHEIHSRIKNTVYDFHIEKLMNRSIFNLSGGEKQKIACASVSVSDPEIIVLDEPSANLDYEGIENLRKRMSIWKEAGKTIIIAEHRLSYIWNLVDRVIVMENGKIRNDMKCDEFRGITDIQMKAMGLRSLVSEKPNEVKVCNEKANPGEVILEKMITIENFDFAYSKDNKIFCIPKLNLPIGEITAIIGANGIGKSTFLHCLCGLERKCKGTMEYKGKRYKSKERMKLMYLVMQDVNHQLFTESVKEELSISMKIPDENRVDEILRQLDLYEYANRHPVSLSGGQKQRVAVASAIASEREILLFDEPTSGLDYKHMIQVSELLRKLKDMGKTVFVVTHDTEFIRSCCTRIINLDKVITAS